MEETEDCLLDGKDRFLRSDPIHRMAMSPWKLMAYAGDAGIKMINNTRIENLI